MTLFFIEKTVVKQVSYNIILSTEFCGTTRVVSLLHCVKNFTNKRWDVNELICCQSCAFLATDVRKNAEGKIIAIFNFAKAVTCGIRTDLKSSRVYA